MRAKRTQNVPIVRAKYSRDLSVSCGNLTIFFEKRKQKEFLYLPRMHPLVFNQSDLLTKRFSASFKVAHVWTLSGHFIYVCITRWPEYSVLELPTRPRKNSFCQKVSIRFHPPKPPWSRGTEMEWWKKITKLRQHADLSRWPKCIICLGNCVKTFY